jgi:hypothetical protein
MNLGKLIRIGLVGVQVAHIVDNVSVKSMNKKQREVFTIIA